jgi:hypothetical protein
MMDAFEILIKQADEKVEQLKEYLAEGRPSPLRSTRNCVVRFAVYSSCGDTS